MLNVSEFLTQERAKPFAWGQTDCCARADRWVKIVSGISPLGVYGRRHGNSSEAYQWLDEPGGIAVAVNRVMRVAGFKKTEQPLAGDIGLIVVDGEVCVSIFDGTFWNSRNEVGEIGSREFRKAWSVTECPRR